MQTCTQDLTPWAWSTTDAVHQWAGEGTLLEGVEAVVATVGTGSVTISCLTGAFIGGAPSE